MTDRAKPILFSGPMVRAILDGRKTQTRRVLKPQLDYMLKDRHERWPSYREEHWQRLYAGTFPDGTRCIQSIPHAVGDLLWVREKFKVHEGGTIRDPGSGFVLDHIDPEIEYAADSQAKGRKWKPSIHMPRWASRITLRVTDVRVQRLQDINGVDAKAEGVSIPSHIPEDGADMDYARRAFKELWTSINGPGSWDANPWVAAYSFERVTP